MAINVVYCFYRKNDIARGFSPTYVLLKSCRRLRPPLACEQGTGFCMLITPYLDGFNVDPETKQVLDAALEMTRESLGLTDDFANGIIAKRVIELAKAGERNPDRLCEGAIEKLGGLLYGDCPAPQAPPPHPSLGPPSIAPNPPRLRVSPRVPRCCLKPPKSRFCDRHHSTAATTRLASFASDGYRDAVLTFDVPPKHLSSA